jgi:hypothetical protein
MSTHYDPGKEWRAARESDPFYRSLDEMGPIDQEIFSVKFAYRDMANPRMVEDRVVRCLALKTWDAGVHDCRCWGMFPGWLVVNKVLGEATWCDTREEARRVWTRTKTQGDATG